ncbi:hypothetical protein OK349_17800 [Sphingomonas sp. BT-65]|uniref:hypothetical protein n=1 Tax=Sphingomonas sp. BT-65 TaxID=2989821 RepID=UPI002236AF34|nr:hypothetical protein [Sphingomonas sp. BT-65]MCW4463565.1 hypothetical protein [Sphingomonas sp. BT-65]
MTVYDGVQWLCLIVGVWLVLLARDHLRMNAPKVRVTLGGTGVVLAIFIFLGVMVLLPRPWESGFSPLINVTMRAACFLFAGLLILSLSEIAGGTVQAFRRWRYHRRNVS